MGRVRLLINGNPEQAERGHGPDIGTNVPTYTPPSGTPGTYYFRVIVANTGAGCNTLTSAVATVVIAQEPDVVISVDNNIICQGGSATISSVVTLGSGTYIYEWQRSPANANTWTNITSGGNGANYNVPSGTIGSYDYRLLVQDVVYDCGDPVSNSVNVTVGSQPNVSAFTNNAYICIGGSALLTSSVNGGSGSFSYQWQSSVSSGGPWTNIPGATSANYNAPGSVPGLTWYQVIVTDNSNNCNDPISNAVSVTVIAQPTVDVSTLTPVICINGEITINSTVNNGSGLYMYQWQTAAGAGGPWNDVAGNGNFAFYSEVLTFAGTSYYRVLVQDLANGCGSMISAVVPITVNPNPEVEITPEAQTVCIGGSALMTALVTNGSGDYSYQWEYSPDGSSWTDVPSGGNASTYDPPTGATGSTYYRVLLTDNGNGCSNPYSELVYVIVEDQPVASITIDNPIICVDGSATISSLVNFGSGFYTYQWQESSDGNEPWSDVASNGNSATYNVPSSVSGVTWYRVVVSDAANGCADPVSNSLNVTIQDLPTVAIDPDEDIICQGGTTVIQSTILNGSGFYTYQWQSSPDGQSGTWSIIGAGGSSANYSVPSGSPSTTYYRLILTDAGSGCGSSVSNEVPVTIEASPTVSLTVDNSVICIGGSSIISASAVNGSGAFSYQWQSSPNGSNSWSNVGSNQNTYTVNGLAAGTTYYRVIVSDSGSGCADPVSENTTVIVQSGPSVSISADNDSVCVFGPVELTPSVINGSGLYLYQWQSSPDGQSGTWSDISGANAVTYSPLTDTPGNTWYRVVVTDLGSGCGDPQSNAIQISVFAQPTLSISIDTPVICVGGNATILSTITNGSGVFSYQWQESINGSNWTDIVINGNSSTYDVPSSVPASTFFQVNLNGQYFKL